MAEDLERIRPDQFYPEHELIERLLAIKDKIEEEPDEILMDFHDKIGKSYGDGLNVIKGTPEIVRTVGELIDNELVRWAKLRPIL